MVNVFFFLIERIRCCFLKVYCLLLHRNQKYHLPIWRNIKTGLLDATFAVLPSINLCICGGTCCVIRVIKDTNVIAVQSNFGKILFLLKFHCYYILGRFIMRTL